jgi:hypothetical protein
MLSSREGTKVSTPGPDATQSRTKLPRLGNFWTRRRRVVHEMMKPTRSVISVSPDLSKLIDLMKFGIGAYIALRYGIQL